MGHGNGSKKAVQLDLSSAGTEPFPFHGAWCIQERREVQVGKDQNAAAFLGDLDKDPQVGRMIDCVSDYELEQASIPTRKLQGPQLLFLELKLA